MLYAAELGPIETSDEGALHIYIAFLDDEAMTPDAQATAADALEKMATLAASRGHTELLCEPSLAKAGKRCGFKSAKMPVPTMLEITRAVALKKPSCRSRAGAEDCFRTVGI